MLLKKDFVWPKSTNSMKSLTWDTHSHSCKERKTGWTSLSNASTTPVEHCQNRQWPSLRYRSPLLFKFKKLIGIIVKDKILVKINSYQALHVRQFSPAIQGKLQSFIWELYDNGFDHLKFILRNCNIQWWQSKHLFYF